MTLDKALGGLKVAVALAGAVLLVMLFLGSGRQPRPAGILARGEPIQTPADSRSWHKNGFTITALARYHIEAYVFSTEPYWFDAGAALAPVDFAVTWGPMSDPAVFKNFSFWQGSRWFSYRARGGWPLPQDVIESHSANVHLIPASPGVERQLKAIHASDVVDMRGYLVEARGSSMRPWRSSLTRTDTGSGACELMWVEEISTRP